MKKNLNYYLFTLLITILGILLLFINAKKIIIFPGLLIIAIFLMVTPILSIVLVNDASKNHKIFSIILLLIILFAINYIFVITQDSIVGMTDQHDSIFQYKIFFSDNKNFNFSNAINLSSSFIGLYIIFYFISIVTNLDIFQMAFFIPQLLNIILIIMVYFIINRLHSHNIAIIASLLYGFEVWVLYFGQEMRTQTLGILLLFSAILIMLIFKEKLNFDNKYLSILLIFVLFGIITSAFVSVFLSIFVFLGFLLIEFIYISILKNNEKFLLTFTMFFVFLFGFIFYLYYINLNMFAIPEQIKYLIYNIETKSSLTFYNVLQSTTSKSTSISFEFITFLDTIILRLYQVALVVYIFLSIKQKVFSSLFIIGGFIPLIILYYITQYIPILSPPRVFVVINLLFVLSLSFCLIKFLNSTHDPFKKKILNFVIGITIIIILITSIFHMPNYIIGETKPLRSEKSIDTTIVYNADLPQKSTYNFINNYNTQLAIVSENVFDSYYMKLLVHKNNESHPKNFKNMFLLILHDKFYGKEYVERNLLPSRTNFNKYDTIYSNDDYLIFFPTV